MTVKELKALLDSVPDDLEVVACVSTLMEGAVHGRVDDDDDVSVCTLRMKEVSYEGGGTTTSYVEKPYLVISGYEY